MSWMPCNSCKIVYVSANAHTPAQPYTLDWCHSFTVALSFGDRKSFVTLCLLGSFHLMFYSSFLLLLIPSYGLHCLQLWAILLCICVVVGFPSSTNCMGKRLLCLLKSLSGKMHICMNICYLRVNVFREHLLHKYSLAL